MQSNRQKMNKESIRNQLASGKRVAATAAILTVLLAVGKGMIGQIRGSPALTADAVHSFADTLAILASWVGLKLAERSPTKRFPFGLYRVENLAAFLVSLLLLLAGGHLLVESVQGLLSQAHRLHHSMDVLVAALLSAVISFGIYAWEKQAGTRLGSQSLLANADESRVDIMTSVIVFVGTGASYIGIAHVEFGLTAAISMLIIWLGIKHGRVALFSLLDASPDPELERRVIAVAKQVPGVMRVAEVQLRQAGLFWFGITRLQLRKSVDITRGHEIAHHVARAVREAYPRIESLTVHLEPFAPEELTVLVPVAGNTLESPLSEHFGRAPFFALATMAGGSIKSLTFIENPASQKQARAGLAAVKHIFEKNSADAVITHEIGEIAFHALREYYVEVYSAPDASLGEALRRLAQGTLPVLSGATHASDAAAAPSVTTLIGDK